MTSGPRLAVVTDLMAPYRVPVFNALHDLLGERLNVFFMGAYSNNRQWKVTSAEARFRYTVLEGRDFSPGSGGFNHFWNPGTYRALDSFDPQVVVIGGYHHPTSYAALAYARLKRRKLVLWSESTAFDARPSSMTRAVVKRWFRGKCDAFLVPGTASNDYLKSFGIAESKIFLAPNSIDVDAFEKGSAPFRTEEARRDFRDLHGLPQFLILFVGRLSPEKGFPTVIEVASRLQSSGRDVGIVVAGDGERRAEYLNAASQLKPGSALFVGFLQQKQLPLYYAQADVLVLPSTSEPWGLVVNEALSCHLPVLCSPKVGAAYDLVSEGETGYLCQNADDYVAAIERLMDSEGDRCRMSQCAVAKARQFTPQATAGGFQNLLETLTARMS